MNNVMILLYTEDCDGAEVFINGQYMGAIDKDTFVLDKILSVLNENMMEEKINLDSYLTEDERDMFYLSKNFHITKEEQDAILNEEIDYAFDMIKNRIK